MPLTLLSMYNVFSTCMYAKVTSAMSDFVILWTVKKDALFIIGFPGGSEVKASACNAGDLGSIPGSRRSLWRRKWQPTRVFLPGEPHGQRSLVGYSPRDRRVRHDWATSLFTLLSLFITGDWNAKVGSQQTPGVTGKFGLGVQNKAGQKLTSFAKRMHWS